MTRVENSLPAKQPSAAPVAGPLVRPTGSARQVVAWCVAASLCLVVAGIVRGMQATRYEEDKNSLVACPFPLKTIPKSFDGWRVLDGSQTVLDPLTTRLTGSTDHMMSSYVDEQTGQMLSVLVLFGPAEPVMPHTPQVCYPASGFQAVGPTVDKDIKIGDHEVASFRSSVFAKPGGRTVIRNAVYHSFLLDGRWSPAIDGRKLPRRSPGIFKVQIQRRVMEGEMRDGDEPIEDFVQKLLPVLEKMVKESSRRPLPAIAAR